MTSIGANEIGSSTFSSFNATLGRKKKRPLTVENTFFCLSLRKNFLFICCFCLFVVQECHDTPAAMSVTTAYVNEDRNGKDGKRVKVDSDGWYEIFNGNDEPVALPKDWRVIRRKKSFDHIIYAVEHDLQSKYDGYDVKKNLGAIIIHISKSEVTNGQGSTYTGEFAFLNQDMSFTQYNVFIFLDEAMRDCPLAVKIQRGPSDFVGTILSVKARMGHDKIRLSSKVKLNICSSIIWTQSDRIFV